MELWGQKSEEAHDICAGFKEPTWIVLAVYLFLVRAHKAGATFTSRVHQVHALKRPRGPKLLPSRNQR